MESFKIESCMGNKGCPNSVCDTSKLVEEIVRIAEHEKISDFISSKVKGPLRKHNCFKVGIANCPNACSQVQITDFAVTGKVKINIDSNLCINCGNCTKVCFERALVIKNNKLFFNEEKCIGCGMCVKICENNSIKISEKGFKVEAGGKLGRHPILALKIRDFASFDETLNIFKKILSFYKKNSLFGERLGTILQRMNIKNLSEYIIE